MCYLGLVQSGLEVLGLHVQGPHQAPRPAGLRGGPGLQRILRARPLRASRGFLGSGRLHTGPAPVERKGRKPAQGMPPGAPLAVGDGSMRPPAPGDSQLAHPRLHTSGRPG